MLKRSLIALLLGAVLAGSHALAADAPSSQQKGRTQASSAPAVGAVPRSPFQPNRFPGRARMYYEAVWGIDFLSVKLAESGQLVRFTYRVIDAEKAKPLNDKKNEPSLIDPRAGVSLVVPTMAKVGQLRQTGAPEAGKAYWIVFSNKGRPVKKGDRVDVVIGQFRAQGLVVD